MLDKVVLIRPENVYHYNNYPALNLISLGSKLKTAGYDVKIINCALEKNPFEAVDRELSGALFIGISLLTSEVPGAYRMVKYVKEHSGIPVVIGGPHCTLFPEQMAKCGYIDYVVVGEGEEHIEHIAKMIKWGERRYNKVFYRQAADIECLPLPDYALDERIEQFITSYLTDKLSQYVARPMRWLPYESSRGCPSQCSFCINTVIDNNTYRKKSAAKVLNEIEYIVRKYAISHLKIIDDNFFVDIDRARTICEGIMRMKLPITWDGECRCDYFNEHMLNDKTLKLLKRAGLIQLTLGIESGSRHSLKLMKKGITPEQSEYAVRKCDQHGIIARSSFILEVPGETLDDIKQTIRFVNKLRKYSFFTCGVGTFRPYPRCDLTRGLIEQKYLTEPIDFDGWTDRDIVDMYTSTEYIRPWQVNGEYSESAAYYLNIESVVRLGNYQIDNEVDRWKNTLFMLIAKLRNRFLFYGFPIDKELYKRFLKRFYKRRQSLEKANIYPVIKLDKATVSL